MDATDFIEHYWWMFAFAGAAAIALRFVLSTAKKNAEQRAASEMSPVELRFRNVFAMITEERRQALIDYNARKYGCGREEAMMHAVEDRARDEGRW